MRIRYPAARMESFAATPAHDRGFAARMRGDRPLSWLAFVVILAGSLVTAILGALLALGWAALSGTPWRDLGLVRPRHWALTVVGGVAAGVVFKLAMKSIVMPLLGAPAMNPSFQYLAGNASEFHKILPMLVIGAGFGEEVLYRGYFFERCGRLFGKGRAATVATVIVTTVLFAAAHYTGQGLPGVEQAFFTGLIFATLYARLRALPFLMIAHASFDVFAAWLIYHRLETTVAHWFFK